MWINYAILFVKSIWSVFVGWSDDCLPVCLVAVSCKFQWVGFLSHVPLQVCKFRLVCSTGEGVVCPGCAQYAYLALSRFHTRLKSVLANKANLQHQKGISPMHVSLSHNMRLIKLGSCVRVSFTSSFKRVSGSSWLKINIQRADTPDNQCALSWVEFTSMQTGYWRSLGFIVELRTWNQMLVSHHMVSQSLSDAFLYVSKISEPWGQE